MESKKGENEKNNEEKNNENFENIDKKEIENMQKQENSTNEYFFAASLAQSIGSAGAKIGTTIGGALDSVAKIGRNVKKKLKSTFSKENMKNVGKKIKSNISDVGKKISNAGSSIKTKALGLRVSSNMNSFYMLKLKDVLENYSESESRDDFTSKIKDAMEDYKDFVSGKVKLWLNNEEREKALGDKIKAGYDELEKKYFMLDYKWLEKKIPSFSKKIRIEILKKENCINALKNHLEKYGKIDPLWDILTRGSKITRSGVLKLKTINLLLTMTNCLSNYEGKSPMDVGVYSNSLMSYLLKNFKGKGKNKDQDWKLKCGLLLVRYSQQEGSYFDSLGKMVDERVNKIHKSISSTRQVAKLQKSCKTIPEMLDKASGSKNGTASIAIGVGMSCSNATAIEVLKGVYTSKKIEFPDSEIKDIQNHSGSINNLSNNIIEIINRGGKYDTDPEYKRWRDSLSEIIGASSGVLDKIRVHKHLNEFNTEDKFLEYMNKDYKKERDEILNEYMSKLEKLKKDLEKYSSEEYYEDRNPELFNEAEEIFKNMLSDSDEFIENEINDELKKYNSKKSKEKVKKGKNKESEDSSSNGINKETENINSSSNKEETTQDNENRDDEKKK